MHSVLKLEQLYISFIAMTHFTQMLCIFYLDNLS